MEQRELLGFLVLAETCIVLNLLSLDLLDVVIDKVLGEHLYRDGVSSVDFAKTNVAIPTSTVKRLRHVPFRTRIDCRRPTRKQIENKQRFVSSTRYYGI